jgi:fatty acid desaturase
MRQVGQQMAGQVGEGAQALRARFTAAFTSTPQVRYDPQTGQPLPQPARNNRALGIALAGIGILMLASYIPGGSGFAVALMLLAGGFYLRRRAS